MSAFINLSNHPSEHWSEKQRRAAGVYGEIEDMPFPAINAAASEADIGILARQYADRIKKRHPGAVMCQGEFTFVFAVVNELLKAGIICVAACSDRAVKEYTDEEGMTQKEAVFEFERFREYRVVGKTGE